MNTLSCSPSRARKNQKKQLYTLYREKIFYLYARLSSPRRKKHPQIMHATTEHRLISTAEAILHPVFGVQSSLLA
jgi:hypothetical protein